VPWSRKQKRVARAVTHGWKPTGSAKGFTRDFAEQVIEESGEEKKRRRRAESKLGRGARAAPRR
jgi:hypothetical protein